MPTDKNYKIEIEKLRNWHWMWSKFYYYHKKNYGYFNALKKTFGQIIKIFFKIYILFYFNNSVLKAIDILMQYLIGLFNSMIGKKSWYRIKNLMTREIN